MSHNFLFIRNNCLKQNETAPNLVKSLIIRKLGPACKIRFQNLPRQIETNFYQLNFDESRSEQIWMCLDLTNFLRFFIQGHTSGEGNLPYYPSVETDRDNNFKPN